MNTYKKHRGEGVLLLTRPPRKGVCPERPSGVKDLSCHPMRMRIRSERSESKDLSSHPTTDLSRPGREGCDLVGKDLSSSTPQREGSRACRAPGRVTSLPAMASH